MVMSFYNLMTSHIEVSPACGRRGADVCLFFALAGMLM